MDPNQKRAHIMRTSEACTNMIGGIRQLRLSVLDLFNTLADAGVDPDRSPQPHHDHRSSNAVSRQQQQQNMLNLATSHSLCTASSPSTRVQKQLEQQQQTDLIQYVNQAISSITSTMAGLDAHINVLLTNGSLINTGEAVHLGMETSPDKHNLYVDLCSSYKTLSKLHDYSFQCHSLLHQQSLKRVHKRTDGPMMLGHQQMAAHHGQQQSQASLVASRNESLVATFNPYKIPASKQYIANMLNRLLENCPHMKVHYSQPFGHSTGLLQVSVDRVLKAILVLRGIMVDSVVVKAYHESFSCEAIRSGGSVSLMTGYPSMALSQTNPSVGAQFVDPENDDIDLWSDSRYNVFRRLTHHANAAVLHFQYPMRPELAIKSFLSWFNSYHDLFKANCTRCNMKLRKFTPPICREFQVGFYPHHENCK